MFSHDIMRRRFRMTEVEAFDEAFMQGEASGRFWSSYARGPEASAVLGSATFILSANFRELTDRLVIEGAPGQGKSTITQYVCQVHRMKLLELDEELQSVPQPHRDAPVRLPLRVDLRDFASWLRPRESIHAGRRRNSFGGMEQIAGKFSIGPDPLSVRRSGFRGQRSSRSSPAEFATYCVRWA